MTQRTLTQIDQDIAKYLANYGVLNLQHGDFADKISQTKHDIKKVKQKFAKTPTLEGRSQLDNEYGQLMVRLGAYLCQSESVPHLEMACRKMIAELENEKTEYLKTNTPAIETEVK